MNTFKNIKVAVAGTGYVGLSIATLLSQHHHVSAVDVIPEKVEKLNNKISPIQDDYIEKYLAEKPLNLVATLDGKAAYKDADFVVIAAPTNYDPVKNYFDTSHVEEVISIVAARLPSFSHSSRRLATLNLGASSLSRLESFSSLGSCLPIDGVTPIPICAKVEAELSELDAEEAAGYLADLGLQKSGLETLAQAAYHLLGLQSYFTAGEMEVKAWTVRIGAKAPEAAGVIHSDFERGFIKAEVASYEDYVELGGEAGCKNAGKLRIEGKDYVVADGDIMHFRFNV